MAESFSKWLFRSVWKIFLTCEEKYFSSHVMDFSVKKKIEVLTKLSQQLREQQGKLRKSFFTITIVTVLKALSKTSGQKEKE